MVSCLVTKHLVFETFNNERCRWRVCWALIYFIALCLDVSTAITERDSVPVRSLCPCNSASVMDVLSAFYQSTSGDLWHRKANWLNRTVSVCTWEGVGCCRGGNETFVNVVLPRNNMFGTLPLTLSEMTFCVVDLSGNRISGSLHPQFSIWGNALKKFDIADNNVSGALPFEFSNWTLVEYVNVSGNCISGTLHEAFSNWSSIQTFSASSIMLTGTLPQSFGDHWGHIKTFSSAYNIELSGTLPATYGVWSASLREFSVSGCAFNGTIPHSFANWSSLMRFQVPYNNLSGTIPPQCANSWLAIIDFEVSSNHFSGTLHAAFSKWVTVELFLAGDNNFTGTLPPEYGDSWNSIVHFKVHRNALDGTLPQSYARWGATLSLFHVGDNQLSGTLPPPYQNWTALGTFRANSNKLSGTLPPEYSSWVLLTIFTVANNMLSGSLPVAYSNWSLLESFQVAMNHLTSSIPAAYGTMPWKVFVASRNYFSGAIPFTGVGIRMLDNNRFTSFAANPATFLGGLLAVDNNRINGTITVMQVFHAIPMLVSTCNNTALCVVDATATPMGLGVQYFCKDLLTVVLDGSKEAIEVAWLATLLNASSNHASANDSCVQSYAQPNATGSAAPSAGQAATSPGFVTATGASVAILAAFGDVTSATGIRRLALWPRCGAPPRALMHSDVDMTDAPLQLSIGDAGGAAHRGAVVGNLAVVALFGVAACCAMCGHAASRARKKRRRFRGLQTTLTESMVALRLPGALGAIAALLFQPTLLSALMLMVGESPSGWGEGDVCLGALGCCACAGWIAALCWALVVRFRAVAGRVGDVDSGGKNDARWRWWLSWAVVARVKWRNEQCGVLFVERFGLLFNGNSAGRHWWAVGDMCVTAVLCAVVSVVPASDVACAVEEWLVTCVAALWLAATVLLLPKHRRAALVSSIVVNGVYVAICLCRVLSAPAIVVDALTIIAFTVSVAALFLVVIGGRLLSWKSAQSEAIRPPASELSHNSPSTRAVQVLPSRRDRPRSVTPGRRLADEKLRSVIEMICDQQMHGCRMGEDGKHQLGAGPSVLPRCRKYT